jgi:hypothetical protein
VIPELVTFRGETAVIWPAMGVSPRAATEQPCRHSDMTARFGGRSAGCGAFNPPQP